jgi:hypothetical protein
MGEIATPETLSKDAYLELPPHERGHYLREKIQETLELNQNEGVSVTDLEENLPFDKRAIQKHLEVLTHTNVAYTSKVGPTRLYFPNERAVHSSFDREITLAEREFGVSKIENKLGEFLLIKEIKEDDIGGGILVPYNHYPEFVEELRSVKEALKYDE